MSFKSRTIMALKTYDKGFKSSLKNKAIIIATNNASKANAA
jgi:hypothetical protein